MSEPERTPSDDELAALRAEIDQVERDVVGHVEPGRWAMVIAFGAFALLVAAVLPWVGPYSGWEVLLGRAAAEYRIGLLPRLFAASSLFFGVLLSAVTLFTRRWGLAWLCALGSAFSVVHGLWAVWSRQTAPVAAGPGAGMVLALLTMIVLAVQWLRLAFSRPT
ncbi:MAG TPA: hypothetical protein VGJ95_12870 [Pseudonocardiaceae bacterium]|jgi:hypothetical protein